ncbi:MAG: HlyD family efflux transporter periplasmic adaptor subunit [Alphaproteobacteria bacterium]|nr:HlyD family efflux transporter periplasmic adaptor subunit [Alphaproteobacteria bacterium]
MKRLVPLVVIALAIAALLLRDRILPQAPGQNAWLGAADARLTLVGPLSAGRITSVKVVKGAQVQAGETLFTMDDASARAQVAQAEAALAAAQQSLKDMQSGRRPEELAVIDQQLEQAKANLVLAQDNYFRADSLNNRGITAQAQFDAAKNAVDVAQGRIAELQANKAVAELPGRDAALAAAQAQVKVAEAARDQAQAHLADLTVSAPVAARVDDVFFAAGEVAGAGQPVVSLFTPEALVLRFYVPEPARAKLAAGTQVHFHCDSCAGDLTAQVSHVFAAPEYTPPVIYSENARGKLVYQVEARIDGAHAELQPGLPVQVEPLP